MLAQKLRMNYNSSTCCGRRQVVRHQPSKLIFAGPNPVARSFYLTRRIIFAGTPGVLHPNPVARSFYLTQRILFAGTSGVLHPNPVARSFYLTQRIIFSGTPGVLHPNPVARSFYLSQRMIFAGTPGVLHPNPVDLDYPHPAVMADLYCLNQPSASCSNYAGNRGQIPWPQPCDTTATAGG